LVQELAGVPGRSRVHDSERRIEQPLFLFVRNPPVTHDLRLLVQRHVELVKRRLPEQL
jgi:hypothetical protein